MRLEWHILIALGLDLLFGDPRWLPHPVRAMGRLAQFLEPRARKAIPWPRAAGAVTAVAVILVSGGAAWGLLALASIWHPAAGDVLSVLLIYTTLAARDLARHSTDVFRALAADDLPEARKRVGMIVGRDTDRLDEAGVVRATVESVAENVADGVTAPLLYVLLFGPIGGIVYKAVNTLDSTFGYKNERYLQFGWASAKLDDLVNWLPARLTGPAVCLAAACVGLSGRGAWRVLGRDARNHTSPNAGFSEAAFAGALGVQLGGPNHYFGKPSPKPLIGDAKEPLDRSHIRKANALMLATAFIFLLLGLALRALVVYAWGAVRVF